MNSNFFDQLVNSFLSIQIWGIAKILILLVLLLYLVFAIVVIRQVHLMRRVLNGVLGWPLVTVAWIHLGLAVGVLLLAIVIL